MNSKGNNSKNFDCSVASEGNHWIFIPTNKVNKMKIIWILFGNICRMWQNKWIIPILIHNGSIRMYSYVHESLKLYAVLTIMTQIIICVFDDHFEKLPLWRRDQKLMWNNIKHVLCKLCCYWNAKTVLSSCSVLISRPIPQ